MADIEIETERLILRPQRAEDFDNWAEFHADAESMRFLGGVQSRSETWRSFCTMAGAWRLYGFAMFSMIEKSSGEWIGRAGPWCPEGWPGTEIGWSILRRFQGKGYATEAATAAMDFAIDTLGWTDIISIIDPENLASIAVAKRLGARNLGRVKMPAPYDYIVCDAWGQSAAEWQSSKR